MEGVGIHLFQRIPAGVIVAVAGRAVQEIGGNTVLLHGLQHLQLIRFGDPVYLLKTAGKRGKRLLAAPEYFVRNAARAV